MTLHGKSIIAGNPSSAEGETFQGQNPATGEALEPMFYEASTAEVDAAMQAAEAAFDEFRDTTPSYRAVLLEAIADNIEALGDTLLMRAHAETAVSMQKLIAERARVTGQARMFAQLLRDGTWLEARIDRGLPDREPAPKPDIRRMMQPIGPIVVFGASNFPLAISVAGTDTISALAAGCPVVVKGHPAHPGTSEMVADTIASALVEMSMPAGAFSLVQGKGFEVGEALVKHPLTCAVAFTGSLKGGRALYDAAANRPEPIPFYGELGSVNPVFLLPGALKEWNEKLAEDFVNALTMGVGQYCTNPGLVFAVQSPELLGFLEKTSELVQEWPPSTMLHNGICKTFYEGVQRVRSVAGVHIIAMSDATARGNAAEASAAVFTTDLGTFEANETLREEVFGPVSLITHCHSREELERVAMTFEGQLTASIHGTVEDLKEHSRLIRILERKVGRIIFNGFGTGIEVCPSMHHGGPYPATTHSFFTSIGTAAIYRFVRPVCYQGFPDDCLPIPLQNENSTKAYRLVDGQMTQENVPFEFSNR